MKSLDQVGNTINCLTNDEDQRQELWLHYLSGNSEDTLVSKLEIIKKNEIESYLEVAAIQLLSNPKHSELLTLMEENCSEFEWSLIILVALGLSVEVISEYKGISEVRIRQALSSIRYNKLISIWEPKLAPSVVK